MTGAPEAIVEQSMSDRGYEVRNLSFGPPCGLPRFLSSALRFGAVVFSTAFSLDGEEDSSSSVAPLSASASTPLRPWQGS